MKNLGWGRLKHNLDQVDKSQLGNRSLNNMVNKIMVTDMDGTLYSANNTHLKVLLEYLEKLIAC